MKKRIAVLFLSLLVAACAGAANRDSTAPETVPQIVETLSSWHWTLAQAHYKEGGVFDDLFVPDGKAPQLDIEDGKYRLDNLCSRLSGKLEMLPDQQMKFHPASVSFFGGQTCTDAEARQQQTFRGLLNDTVRYEIQRGKTKSTLRLTGAFGDVLVFAGRKTDVAKYGVRSESVILEVAPWQQVCACEEGNGSVYCLLVRELQLGEKGKIKEEPGPWRNFDPHTISAILRADGCEERARHLDQYIEGVTHKTGTRYVLRVNRRMLKNQPADGRALSYTLEEVLETSSAVQPDPDWQNCWSSPDGSFRQRKQASP